MTLIELTYLVRQEFDRRNLKSKTRYYALNNIADYIQNHHGGNLKVLCMLKSDFKHLYEKYKISINKKMSSAEKSAIDEIYNQLKTSNTSFYTISILDNKTISSAPITEDLMTLKNFKRVKDLSEYMIPKNSGLYAIRIKDVNDFPLPFCNELINRKHDLLYIGIATKSLRERLWKQEFNHVSPATFFRSLGAILGFRPIKGSLYGKKTNNYKFSKEDTENIKSWIKEHILVNFIIASSDLEDIESKLILTYKPLINIDKNPYKIKEISDLRAECLRIAKAPL